MTRREIAGLGVAIVLSTAAFAAHERTVGARDATITSLRHQNDTLRTVVAADSLALQRKDTVRVFRQVTRTDSVLQRIIDTAIVQHHDTVTVTRTVLVEAKAALDSTKGVADACCQLARDRGRRIAVLDSMNTALRASLPSPVKPWLDFGLGVGACAGAVWLAGHR